MYAHTTWPPPGGTNGTGSRANRGTSGAATSPRPGGTNGAGDRAAARRASATPSTRRWGR